MAKYKYTGPVSLFDKAVSNNWKAETEAKSINKAASNFRYQFKTYAKMSPNAGGIKLHGKITLME